MTISGIRSLLRDQGLSGYVVYGEEDNFVLGQTPSQRLVEFLRPGPHERWKDSGTRLDNIDDVLLLICRHISDKLSSYAAAYSETYKRSAVERIPNLHGVLVCAITQCLLDAYKVQADVMPTATELFNDWQSSQSAQSQDDYEDISAAIMVNGMRQVILRLSERMYAMDGRVVMAKLGVPFQDMSQETSPDWAERFQRADQPTQFWFYKGEQGRGLFLVLFGKRCAYAQCASCNLHMIGRDNSLNVSDYYAQVDETLDRLLTSTERQSLTETILSNNGSLFDQKTFPISALLYSVVRIAEALPKLKKVTLETRAEYVDEARMALVKESLEAVRPDITLELAIGVEMQDEHLRNKVFKKGLSNQSLRRCAKSVASASSSLRLYYMYKPLPNMTDEEAQCDILQALEYASCLKSDLGLDLTVHLNPTYVAKDTVLEQAFREGRYEPPSLPDVVDVLRQASPLNVSVYVGLNDEGLAVEGGSFLKPEHSDALSALRKFNSTQKFDF